MIRKLFVLVGLATFLAFCGAYPLAMVRAKGGQNMSMTIKSPAFEEGEAIPRKYTCDGKDVSPPLEWANVPKETKALALICDDPDAPMGTFVHWVLYDLPVGSTTNLSENLPADEMLANGAKQGKNNFGKLGYRGPCPPGGTHRYYFKLYALDAETGLAPGAGKSELLEAMEGHVLAEGQLMGTYKR